MQLEDGKLLRITGPLKEALPFVEKQCLTGYLWIDQICIDQDDRSERGHQVKLMGQIYTLCSCVIVWLGRMSKFEAELPSAKQLQESLSRKEILLPKFSSARSFLNGWRKANGAGAGICSTESLWSEVLESPWFQRAWVFQEVVLPPHAMFILARTSTTPEQAQTISLYELHNVINGMDGSSVAVENIRIMYLCYNEHRQSYLAHSPIEHTLSYLAPRAKTSEEVDRLYAFFGLNFDQKINLTPSYDSSLEVAMIDTATAIIEGTSSLDIFEVIPRAVEKTKHKIKIPTWTPDFREDRLVVPFTRSETNFRRRAEAAPELYPVFIPTHITYYRTTHRGSIYCAGEEKRTIQAHGYVLDHIDTEIGTLSHQSTSERHVDALLERCINAWNKLKRDIEHKTSSGSRHKRKATGLVEATIDFGFAPKPTMGTLRRALVAEDCCPLRRIHSPNYPFETAELPKYTMMQVMRGRTLWMTRSGRLALGSHLLRGDHICLAYGCSNPIALRGQLGGAATSILGTCFLEGWMDPWSNGVLESVERRSAPVLLHIV